MRIWHINPAYLDDKRLVAAHREIHMFLTCVKRGREWGPTRQFKHSLQYAKLIHDVTIAEMSSRRVKKGQTAKEYLSDFNIDNFDEIYSSKPFSPNFLDIQKDIKDLREKWESEEYYYGTGRLDLRYAEAKFNLPRGSTLLRAKFCQSLLG